MNNNEAVFSLWIQGGLGHQPDLCSLHTKQHGGNMSRVADIRSADAGWVCPSMFQVLFLFLADTASPSSNCPLVACSVQALYLTHEYTVCL